MECRFLRVDDGASRSSMVEVAMAAIVVYLPDGLIALLFLLLLFWLLVLV
jgi:hypothetical protein